VQSAVVKENDGHAAIEGMQKEASESADNEVVEGQLVVRVLQELKRVYAFDSHGTNNFDLFVAQVGCNEELLASLASSASLEVLQRNCRLVDPK